MPSVVVISKDREQRNRIQRLIGDLAIEAIPAECVISGVELATAHNVELIICDENLEDLSALDLLETKRDEPALTEIPVLVLAETGRRAREHYDAGCDDFVILPAELSMLPHKVRAIIRRASVKGVSGNFSHLNILDLVQMLLNGHRSGKLDVDCGKIYGTLFFEQGQVTSASTGSDKGEEAFLTLLREAQRGGEFSFSGTLSGEHVERNIEQRTDHLLLGLANLLDESG